MPDEAKPIPKLERKIDSHPNSPTEADWKYFSTLRDEMLEEFSRRHCERLRSILGQKDLTEDQKRHAVYKAVRKDDKLVASLFYDHSRSVMMMQCLGFHAYGLLTPEHIEHFSLSFREWLSYDRSSDL